MIREAACLLLVAPCFGCEAAFTPAVGPTVDTEGHLGIETRAEMSLMLGSKSTLFYFAAAPGTGYDKPAGGATFHHSVALGGEFGDLDATPLVRGRAAVGSRVVVGGNGPELGSALAADLLFGVTPAGTRVPWLLGARLSGELLSGLSSGPAVPAESPRLRGLFSLAFVAHAIVFKFHPEPELAPPEPGPELERVPPTPREPLTVPESPQ